MSSIKCIAIGGAFMIDPSKQDLKKNYRCCKCLARRWLLVIAGIALVVSAVFYASFEHQRTIKRIERINFKDPSNEDLAFLEICRFKNSGRCCSRRY